jgi:hypothetical protein
MLPVGPKFAMMEEKIVLTKDGTISQKEGIRSSVYELFVRMFIAEIVRVSISLPVVLRLFA